MFKLVKSETVPLTPALALEMRQLPPSPTERDLSVKRVDFLRDRLKAGVFHPPHWVKAVVQGKTCRANGQHSSEMLSKLNGGGGNGHDTDPPFPVGMFAHVDTFECQSWDDLALLFRQFDDRRSSRGPADVSGAYQGLQDDLNPVPRWLGKIGVEAITWYRANVLEYDVPKDDDRYTVFNEQQEHDYLLWLADLYRDQDAAHMPNKKEVFAAMYGTYRTDPDAADDFWKEVVAGGREYDDECPSSVLAEWYKRILAKEFKIKPEQYYIGAIYAWNAARDGKDTIRDIRSEIKKKLTAIK